MGDKTTPIPFNKNASDASVRPDIDDGVTSRSNGKAPRQDGDRPVLLPVSETAPPETPYLAPSASGSRLPLMTASDPMREIENEATSSPRFLSRSSSLSSGAGAAARRTRKILGLARKQPQQQHQPSSSSGSVNGGSGGGDRGGSSGTNPHRKVSFSSKVAPGTLPSSNGGNTSETRGTPGTLSLVPVIEAAEQALVAAAHATSRPKQQADASARVATAPGEPQLAGVGEQDREGGVLSSSLLGRPVAAAGGGVSHAHRPIAGGAEPFVSRREGIRNGDEYIRANEETEVSGVNGGGGVSKGNREDTSVVSEAREIKHSKESVDEAVAAAALAIGLVEAAMPVGAGVGSGVEMSETAAAAAARVEREGDGGTHTVHPESSTIPRILPRMGRPAHAGNGTGLGREGDLLEEEFARARGLAKEIRPLKSARLAAELGGLLRQAIVGDWHTCAMPVSVPPRSKIQERAEWDAWVASEGVSRKEAMKLFTAAVDELYRRKFEDITSTTANDTSGISTTTTASTPGRPESQHHLDLSLGPLIHGLRGDTGVARDRRRGSTGGSTLTLPNTSQGGMGMSISSSGDRGRLDETVKQKALTATPVLSGRAAAAPGQENAMGGGESRASALEARLERVGGKPGVALAGMGDAEDEGRVFAGGTLTGGGRGDEGELDRRDTAMAFAAALTVTVGQSEVEDTLKVGVLYKKREVLRGWRPRTFIVDKGQRLLRYYLPSSAKPRGSIPLEGCSVGLTVASAHGRGEPGPDGTCLFRIRLVTGPHSPTTPRGSNTSSRFGVYGGSGSEGYGKTYTLAATSFEEAQAWVAAIKAGSDWTPTISNNLVVGRSSERSRTLRTQGSSPSGTREPLLNGGVPTVPLEASSRGGLVEVVPLSVSIGDANGDLGGPRGGAMAAAGARNSRNENDVHASGGGSSSKTMQRRSIDPSGENTRSCAGVTGGGGLSGFGTRGEPWMLSSFLRGNMNPFSSSPPFLWEARGADERKASLVPSVRLRLWIVSAAVAFGLAGVLASPGLRAMSYAPFSAALGRLTRASLSLAWVLVAAIGISAIIAAAVERTCLLREKRSLLQMLRDLDSPGTSVGSNERYFARFWVDVQPLQTELERIRRRAGNPGEFEGPGRHDAQRSPSAPVTILHLVMKAAASAIAKNRTGERLATQALGSGEATTTKVACMAAAAGTLSPAARDGAAESARGGHSGSPPVVVFVEGAEGKSAAEIAAEVERAAGAATGAMKRVSRASVAPPSPRLLRADEVPLLPPGTYLSLARWRLLGGTTAAGGDFSTGTAATQGDSRRLRQLPRRAADCLVEIGRQQQQRASFATIPDVFGKTGPPSPAELKPNGRNNTLGAEMVPDPGGEEAEAPLRVTIRRASALVGDRGVVCAEGTNVPVIAVEVSVVGDATQGNSGTEDFARALRRLLRFAGPE